ncbi:hypothetical protein U9M48_004048 [Paspalum notatum var. saurae]|uniref:Uncharacterized protein n=1 Tax=Paspalum notatum var. saurae TaxID=547442 RepID=A0AAQ3SL35_PASNO
MGPLHVASHRLARPPLPAAATDPSVASLPSTMVLLLNMDINLGMRVSRVEMGLTRVIEESPGLLIYNLQIQWRCCTGASSFDFPNSVVAARQSATSSRGDGSPTVQARTLTVVARRH